MTRESTTYDAAAERFLAVESALESATMSPAPVEGIVYDVQLLSPTALPKQVRRRLAEELSTLRLQEAVDAEATETASGGRPGRTELSAFPRPVVAELETASADWVDELLSVLPEQLIVLTVVDPTVDVGFVPDEPDREQLAAAVGHHAVATAFVFPDSLEVPAELGLPTLSGLFDVVEASSVAELNQRTVPLKPLGESTAFVHTHENRTLSSVGFEVERAAFEAGNIVVEDGVCRIDPELRERLERTYDSQQTQQELVFGGLLATVGALPVVNLILQSTLASSGLVSPLLFVGAVVCMALALSHMGSTKQELKALAATPS